MTVVTLTSTLRGAIGNAYTLAESSTALAVSGATLSGGADYPTSPAPSIDAGVQTFDVAADAWNSDQTNGLTALQQVVNSEQGRFWAARNGTLIYHDRDYIFKQVVNAVALTLSGEPTDTEAAIGQDDTYNVIKVTYTPRATLSTGVVAKSAGNISVPGLYGTSRFNPTQPTNGNTLTVKLPFTDPTTSQPMGALSIVAPLVIPTDYQLFDNPAPGAGFNYGTANPTILGISVAINGNDVELSFVNNALGTLYVQQLQVRGVGLVSYNPVTVIAEDTTSETTYKKHAYTLTLPLPSGQFFAQALASYLLSRYKTPMYRATSITFQKKELIGNVNLYSLELGSVISLSDTQLGISAQKYLVIGLRYKRANGSAGDVTLYLFRLDDTAVGQWDDATYGLWDTATWGI